MVAGVEVPLENLTLYGGPFNLSGRTSIDVCFKSIYHDVLGCYIAGIFGTAINIFVLFVNFKAKTKGMKSFYPTITFLQISNTLTFAAYYIAFVPLMKSFGLICCGFFPIHFNIRPIYSWSLVYGLRAVVMAAFANLMIRSHQVVLLPSSWMRLQPRGRHMANVLIPLLCVGWMLAAMLIGYPKASPHEIFRITAFGKKLLYIAQFGTVVPTALLFAHTLFVMKNDDALSKRTKKMHFQFVKTCLILCAQMFFFNATPIYTTMVANIIGLNPVWSVMEKININLYMVVTNLFLLYYIRPFRDYILKDLIGLKLPGKRPIQTVLSI